VSRTMLAGWLIAEVDDVMELGNVSEESSLSFSGAAYAKT